MGMLDHFISYLLENNNNSLIAKIFGVFTIKTDRFKPVDMIIMENTARIVNAKWNLLKFDLKGSTFNRETQLREDEKNFWR